MTPLRTCAICTATEREARLAPGLLRFRTLPGDPLDVQANDRCVDRSACRRRVELSGEEWPVLDSPAPSERRRQ